MSEIVVPSVTLAAELPHIAPLPVGSEWDFDALTRYDEAIGRVAQAYGLDCYPHVLEVISADTITDEEGNSFYLIQVRTDKSHLGSDEHPLLIIPGMVATVDIVTGEKSVLDYLLKPVLKARSEAMRER